MEPLGVVLVAVLAFAVGTGLGLSLGRAETVSRSVARFLPRRRDRRGHAGPRPGPAATSTIEVIDSLVADGIRRLASWVTSSRDDDEDRLTLAPDGTLTLLFSDIAGSTSLNRRLGDDAFARLLHAHDEEVRTCVRAHDGRVVKTQGDGFLAAFHAPGEAVAAALELREALADEARIGQALDLRIGIHTGRAVTEAGDVFGENVAYAARVAEVARGGDVLVSQAVRDRVEGTTERVHFVGRLFPSRLKGLPGLHQLHRADAAG